ncbi:MAG TPA: serine protease [Terriglobales bacterium]|jgi:S1-C subfamily serine protease|nr:serine protease [Terriglobales bacterium]
MERVIVSSKEVSEIRVPAGEGPPPAPKLPPAIPLWGRVLCALLVLVLPVLCLAAIILRVAFRGQTPRIRYAWTSYLATLLTISAVLYFSASVLVITLIPVPAIVSIGLGDLDERAIFPTLPSDKPLAATEVSQELKPLVAVLSPAQRRWFSRDEGPSASLGAGILLQASPAGYLFGTAKHVANDFNPGTKAHILVAMASGIWATGEVIAHHSTLDLALVWVPRNSGHSDFVQPVSPADKVVEGIPIFVIGHPEGLKYSLSTGIISRLHQSVVQISASVSPGNSGGPVYDERGNLVGVVSAMVDKGMNPNAENLSFAVQADALLHESGWQFSGNGGQYLREFIKAEAEKNKAAAEAGFPAK